MTTIIYAVANKNNLSKVLCSSFNRSKCEEFIANQNNSEAFVIGHKWVHF